MAVLVLIGGAVLFWRASPGVAAILALIVAAAFLSRWWLRRRAVHNFQKAWQPKGKDLLLVYSNSPVWKDYIEANWLPQWGHRAVVLNWSERQKWRRERRPEVALFDAFSGDREFNPLAVFVPQRGYTAQVVRFWRAFREHKHGKHTSLRVAEAQVLPSSTPRRVRLLGL